MEIKFARRTEQMNSSVVRETLKLTAKPDVISFAGGMPAPEVFPVRELQAAMNKVLETSGRVALQYGPTDGYLPLREKIAARHRKAGISCTADDILMISGSQQGLDLAGKLFLDPGDLVVCESPTYTAALSALAISGLPTGRFTFEGFLSVNKRSRKEHLEAVAQERRTMIFYEAPHKLRKTLSDFAKVFGPDRPIALCRELTKVHEEVWRTTLGEAAAHYRETEPRGEFVLVVAGAEEAPAPEASYTLEEAAQLAASLAAGGLSASEAAKEAAQTTGFKKGELYRLLLEQG